MLEEASLEARFNALLEKSEELDDWIYFGTYSEYIQTREFEGFRRCLVLILYENVFIMAISETHQNLAALFSRAIQRSFINRLGNQQFDSYFLATNAPVEYWHTWSCGRSQSKEPDFGLKQSFTSFSQVTGDLENDERMLIAGEVRYGHERSVPQMILQAVQYLTQHTNVVYSIGVFFHRYRTHSGFEIEYFVLGRTEENVFNPDAGQGQERRCEEIFQICDFTYGQEREDFFRQRGVYFLVPPTIVTSVEIILNDAEIRFSLPGTGLGPLGEDLDPVEIVVTNVSLRLFHQFYNNWWQRNHRNRVQAATRIQ